MTRVPGAGLKSFAATRDEAGSYAMVYVPTGRPFTVRMNKVAGGRVKAWWYNPRTGETTRIGECPNAGERQFIPPTPGENLNQNTQHWDTRFDFTLISSYFRIERLSQWLCGLI